MSPVKRIVLAAVLSLSAAFAHAALIEVSQTQDPNPNPGIPPTLSLMFDLNSQLAAQSLTSSNIMSAVFDIYLTDPLNGSEKFFITVGENAFTQLVTKDGNNNVNNGSGASNVNFTLDSATSLNDLKADGIIKLTLAANPGNYAFDKATLTAMVNLPKQSGEVPEPTTIAMLGLGLLGFAASRRKSANGSKV